MLQITDKSKCCGCNACVQRCPKQCIVMHEDEEGFLYPQVDVTLCVDCGLCEKVCPMLAQNDVKKALQIFAAKNKNEHQRLRSSSGGIFILLAEQTIKMGGVVFGARFDKNWEVEHCYVETIEELEPLMRSKYVQSRIGNTYKEAEQFLKEGRRVLFVGTSCQISGLHRFLRKDYNNLLSVDFICHGVPSPGIWRKYLQEIKNNALQSEAAGKNTVLPFSLKSMPVITGINFREKGLGGYGWKKYGFVVHGKSPLKGDQNSVLLSVDFGKDIYMKGFLRNLYLRPSCYNCLVKSGKSQSDLTIGDFWGISKLKPEIDDDKGIGAILVYTHKGIEALGFISCDKIAMTYNDVIMENPAIYSSVMLTNNRKRFWQFFFKTNNIKESVNKALISSFMDKVKGKINIYLGKA